MGLATILTPGRFDIVGVSIFGGGGLRNINREGLSYAYSKSICFGSSNVFAVSAVWEIVGSA